MQWKRYTWNPTVTDVMVRVRKRQKRFEQKVSTYNFTQHFMHKTKLLLKIVILFDIKHECHTQTLQSIARNYFGCLVFGFPILVLTAEYL